MTNEIKALPDKPLDLDLNFEVTTHSKRLPYKMKIKELYETRWKIELAFRDIKHALGILHFHSKKDLFNLQEFFAHLIRYNLPSRIIRHVRLPKSDNAELPLRLNRLFRRYFRYSLPVCFNYRVA